MNKTITSKVDKGIIKTHHNPTGGRAVEDEKVLLAALEGVDRKAHKIKWSDWGLVGTDYVSKFQIVSNELAGNNFRDVDDVCDELATMAAILCPRC